MADGSRSTSRSTRGRVSPAPSDSADQELVVDENGRPGRANRRRTGASEAASSDFTGALSHASGGASTVADGRDLAMGPDPFQAADPWQGARQAALPGNRVMQRKLELNPDLIKSLTERFETNHLALLGSLVVADLRRATVEMKFETINARFDWRLPSDASWHTICSVDLTQTATRPQEEAGREQ